MSEVSPAASPHETPVLQSTHSPTMEPLGFSLAESASRPPAPMPEDASACAKAILTQLRTLNARVQRQTSVPIEEYMRVLNLAVQNPGAVARDSATRGAEAATPPDEENVKLRRQLSTLQVRALEASCPSVSLLATMDLPAR